MKTKQKKRIEKYSIVNMYMDYTYMNVYCLLAVTIIIIKRYQLSKIRILQTKFTFWCTYLKQLSSYFKLESNYYYFSTEHVVKKGIEEITNQKI